MAIRVVADEWMSTGAASVSGADGAASIRLPDRITAYTAAPIWQSALDTLARNPHRPIIVDASRLEYVDIGRRVR
jgi:anti-anti-sigma regulatory factor